MVEREQGCAHHPGLVPEVRGHDAHDVARRLSARSATTARAGSSSMSPPRTAPPPITITFGVERVHEPDQPVAEPAPDLVQHLARERIAVVRQLGDDPAADLLIRGEPPAELRVRLLLGHAHPLAPDRVPRHQRLEAALARGSRRAVRPVQLEHHMAELGAHPRRARGTPRRSRAARRRSRFRATPSPRGARPRPRRCGPRRASTRSRRCPPPPAARAARSSDRGTARRPGRQVVRPARYARLRLHQCRHAEADRLDVGCGRPHLLDGVREDVERLLLGPRPRQVL